jgi:hypothetical protein
MLIGMILTYFGLAAMFMFVCSTAVLLKTRPQFAKARVLAHAAFIVLIMTVAMEGAQVASDHAIGWLALQVGLLMSALCGWRRVATVTRRIEQF